jgi:hypothetical protein
MPGHLQWRKRVVLSPACDHRSRAESQAAPVLPQGTPCSMLYSPVQKIETPLTPSLFPLAVPGAHDITPRLTKSQRKPVATPPNHDAWLNASASKTSKRNPPEPVTSHTPQSSQPLKRKHNQITPADGIDARAKHILYTFFWNSMFLPG